MPLPCGMKAAPPVLCRQEGSWRPPAATTATRPPPLVPLPLPGQRGGDKQSPRRPRPNLPGPVVTSSTSSAETVAEVGSLRKALQTQNDPRPRLLLWRPLGKAGTLSTSSRLAEPNRAQEGGWGRRPRWIRARMPSRLNHSILLVLLPWAAPPGPSHLVVNPHLPATKAEAWLPPPALPPLRVRPEKGRLSPRLSPVVA